MNVKNNRRRKASVEKIEKAFIEMLLSRELHKISVTDICKATGLNRSTFYANYLDVYDLANKLREKLEADFNAQFQDRGEASALKMFRHIYENQLFYTVYFRLGYDTQNQTYVYDTDRAEKDFNGEHLSYHIEFFKNGLNAIIKMWLSGGCRETPEEMAEILKAEYRGR